MFLPPYISKFCVLAFIYNAEKEVGLLLRVRGTGSKTRIKKRLYGMPIGNFIGNQFVRFIQYT